MCFYWPMNMSSSSPCCLSRGRNAVKAVCALAAAALLASGPAAGAQTINEREVVLQNRINYAARTGQINREQRARLQDRLNEIRMMERRAKADGTLTKAEYNRINAAMDGLSKTIQIKKAN